MPTLVVATRNAHKAAEIAAILGPAFTCRSLADFPRVPALAETGNTFAANAAMKARELAGWLTREWAGRDAARTSTWRILADDSGLEVDALDGAPGVVSARFAADEVGRSGNAPDVANNAKLLRLLQFVPAQKRTARFRCVLALLEGLDPARQAEPRLFEGLCEGRIALEPRGQGGFGYDPLFLPDGYAESFAELAEEVKNRLSHRFRALEQLRRYLPAP